MAQRIPVAALKELGKKYNLTHLVMFAYDMDGYTHRVTWGNTQEGCAAAAQAANYIIRTVPGLPDQLIMDSAPLKKLRVRNAELEAEVRELRKKLTISD